MMREKSSSLSGMKYFGSGAIVGAALTLAVPRGVTSVWIRQAPFFVLGLSASPPITMRSKVCVLASPGEVAQRARVLAVKPASSEAATIRACIPPPNPTVMLFNSIPVWRCCPRRKRKIHGTILKP